MSRPARSNDPQNPDYPHGTENGFKLKGCHKNDPCPASPTCTQAAAAAQRARRATYRAARPDGPRANYYRPGPVFTHLKGLIRGGWAIRTIASVSGVHKNALYRVLSHGNITLGTARRVLALNDETLAAGAKRLIPIRLVRWKLQGLYAMGYDVKRLARGLNLSEDRVLTLLYRDKNLTVNGPLHAAVCALFDEWSAALPLRGGNADRTRADAARRGWYTPDHYTLDGHLWGEDDERDEEMERRYAQRDERARLRLDVLVYSLRYGYAAIHLADVLSMQGEDTARAITRIRREAKLKFSHTDSTTAGFEQQVVVNEAYRDRAAEVLAVLERWEADPLGDPYDYCLELGMMQDIRYQLGQPKSVQRILLKAA